MKTRIDSIAVYYLSLLADVRAAARPLGYAVAMHGSLSRDFDLVAVPWTDDARPAAELVEAVRAAAGGQVAETFRDNAGTQKNPTAKPHGRLAWVILLGEWTGGAYIDLSVMPRTA